MWVVCWIYNLLKTYTESLCQLQYFVHNTGCCIQVHLNKLVYRERCNLFLYFYPKSTMHRDSLYSKSDLFISSDFDDWSAANKIPNLPFQKNKTKQNKSINQSISDDDDLHVFRVVRWRTCNTSLDLTFFNIIILRDLPIFNVYQL